MAKITVDEIDGMFGGTTPSPPPPSTPPTPPSMPASGVEPAPLGGQSVLSRSIYGVTQPFIGAAEGLLGMPLAVLNATRAAGDIDWTDISPGQLGEAAVETAKQTAPLILPAVGGIVGSMVAPGPGTTAGAVGGQFLNSAIEQLITGQPKDPLETLVEAATIPATGKLLGLGRSALRGTAKIIPGGSRVRQEMAVEAAEQVPRSIALEPSKPKYAAYHTAVAQPGGNPVVPLNKLGPELAKLEYEEGKALGYVKESVIGRALNNWRKAMAPNAGAVDLETMRVTLSRTGKLARTLEKDGEATAAGAMKDIFKAGWQDLESYAASSPQAKLLKDANRAFRREMAVETLKDWTEGTAKNPSSGAINVSADGNVYINAGKILNKIRADDFFRASLTPSELESIVKMYEVIAKTPRLPPPPGAMFGAGIGLARTAGATGVAYATTQSSTTAAWIGAIVAYAPAIISKLTLSPVGRKALRFALREKDFLTPREFAELGVAAGVFGANPDVFQQRLPSVPGMAKSTWEAIPSPAGLVPSYIKEFLASKTPQSPTSFPASAPPWSVPQSPPTPTVRPSPVPQPAPISAAEPSTSPTTETLRRSDPRYNLLRTRNGLTDEQIQQKYGVILTD